MEASLTRLCAIWQKTLGLSDWEINVKVVGKKLLSETSQKDIYANARVFPEPQSQKATVLIIRPKDYIVDNAGTEYDPEFLLIHELLHLPLELFSDRNIDNSDYYDGKSMFREQFINRMADLLLSLTNKRSKDAKN